MAVESNIRGSIESFEDTDVRGARVFILRFEKTVCYEWVWLHKQHKALACTPEIESVDHDAASPTHQIDRQQRARVIDFSRAIVEGTLTTEG